MVGGRGIEPLTPSMSRKCSPAELTALPRASGLRSTTGAVKATGARHLGNARRVQLCAAMRIAGSLELHPIRPLEPERRPRFGRRRDLETQFFDNTTDLGHLLGIALGELPGPI